MFSRTLRMRTEVLVINTNNLSSPKPGRTTGRSGLGARRSGGAGSGRRCRADNLVMNGLSTAGFVPPSVYIRFPVFFLTKVHSGQLTTIPWRARGTVGLWATRPVGILFCPAPPRPTDPPRSARNQTSRGMLGFLTRQVNVFFPDILGMKRVYKNE